MIDEELNEEDEIEEDVDLVDLNIEKPLWRSRQSFRYRIERRFAQIKKVEEEIEDLYQEVANLNAGCRAGDILVYNSDENKTRIVIDVDFVDYRNSIVTIANINKLLEIEEGTTKTYSSKIIIENYNVIGRVDSIGIYG